MRLTCRKTTPADTAVLVEFNLGLASETEETELPRERLTEGVKAVFAEPSRGFYLLVEADGQVAGGLLITTEWSDWRNADFWWIQSVFIRPEFRRKGVYSFLHRSVVEMARTDGNVCGIRLYVDRQNARARTTYESLGMIQSRYDFYEQPVEDAQKFP
jgi:GNAT superfamily N-acetyltransferase